MTPMNVCLADELSIAKSVKRTIAITHVIVAKKDVTQCTSAHH